MIADERCIIVGAGPAGLAAAFVARSRGLSPLVLERAERVGGAWRVLPPTLRCLSGRENDRFPDGDFPRGDGPRASAAEVLALLERAQRRHRFRVQGGTRVLGLERVGELLALNTSRGTVTTKTLVVATGEFGVPRLPTLPGLFAGQSQHYHDFEAATVVPGTSIGVVGAGNSGAEVVRSCVAAGATVTISSARPIPRPSPRLPPFAQDLLWWLSALPISKLPARLGCVDSTPVVGSELYDAVASGRVRRVSRAVGLYAGGLVTESQGPVAVDRLVFCTGFRRETQWLSPALSVDGDSGAPAQQEGLSTALPVVGFIGIPCMRTRRSGFLRGFADDAAAVIRRLEGSA